MQRVLVGLDASPRAAGVLEVAAKLAQGVGAKLVLFRAVGIPIEVPPEAYSLTPDNLEEALEKAAIGSLATLAATLPAGLTEKIRVAVGTPWEALCHVAKEENVDLIVVGSHGYRGIDRVLGTTASRIVNHADRSVLVVRAPERI